MYFETECIMAIQDFGTNQKHVRDLPLDIDSNLGPILPHFTDIAGFLLRRDTPPLFYWNFGGGSKKRRP